MLQQQKVKRFSQLIRGIVSALDSDVVSVVPSQKFLWLLRLILQVDKMSEFMGMNKLAFLDKYTEEKIVDGQMYTKLAHKEDLSCILLDIGLLVNLHCQLISVQT